MKYLKLFEQLDGENWWDDPFGEESPIYKELNLIYPERNGSICFIKIKNKTLFRFLGNHYIDYGPSEYFKPRIPLSEKTIKRIIDNKIEVRLSKWASKRLTFSELLRITNLKLEDIIFLDEKNIKKYIL